MCNKFRFKFRGEYDNNTDTDTSSKSVQLSDYTTLFEEQRVPLTHN